MAVGNQGLHHFHQRKRLFKSYEQIPSTNNLKNFMDKSIYIVGILGPLMTLPQVYKIWAEKSANSLSMATWITYWLMAVFWLIYGIIHKEKPIIITNFLFMVINLSIVV